MLRPEEVEQLVCGCPTLDLAELRKVTFYDGYKQDDKTIQHFWEVMSLKNMACHLGYVSLDQSNPF